MKQIPLRPLLAVLALAMLSGCPGKDDSTGQQSPSPTAEATTEPSSQAPSGKPTPKVTSRPVAGIRRGIFIFGEDFQIFKACGSKEEVWVQDTPAKDMESKYKAQHLMELEPVFVELSGDLKPTGKSTGFAADYKQTLHVKKLVSLRPGLSDGTCFATDFVAQGPPTDWSLQVLRDGDVFFKSHEGEFPVVETLAYSAPKQEGNHWRYEFHFRTPEEETLKADFAEESCSHGGISYSFSAKIEFRGVTYTGCAKKL